MNEIYLENAVDLPEHYDYCAFAGSKENCIEAFVKMYPNYFPDDIFIIPDGKHFQVWFPMSHNGKEA